MFEMIRSYQENKKNRSLFNWSLKHMCSVLFIWFASRNSLLCFTSTYIFYVGPRKVSDIYVRITFDLGITHSRVNINVSRCLDLFHSYSAQLYRAKTIYASIFTSRPREIRHHRRKKLNCLINGTTCLCIDRLSHLLLFGKMNYWWNMRARDATNFSETSAKYNICMACLIRAPVYFYITIFAPRKRLSDSISHKRDIFYSCYADRTIKLKELQAFFLALYILMLILPISRAHI